MKILSNQKFPNKSASELSWRIINLVDKFVPSLELQKENFEAGNFYSAEIFQTLKKKLAQRMCRHFTTTHIFLLVLTGKKPILCFIIILVFFCRNRWLEEWHGNSGCGFKIIENNNYWLKCYVQICYNKIRNLNI